MGARTTLVHTHVRHVFALEGRETPYGCDAAIVTHTSITTHAPFGTPNSAFAPTLHPSHRLILHHFSITSVHFAPCRVVVELASAFVVRHYLIQLLTVLRQRQLHIVGNRIQNLPGHLHFVVMVTKATNVRMSNGALRIEAFMRVEAQKLAQQVERLLAAASC